MKVVTIIGARPQFIKAAVVSRAFKEHRTEVVETIVHTGQHYDSNMSAVFFDELGIPKADYNLEIGGGTHGQNTGRMIEKIEEVLKSENPDWVLVYGDTDSTLAAALAAAKLHIPVAHVEAGLRSFNRQMPEEINRVLTDHVADLLFAPTETAVMNLSAEGIDDANVQLVGDVMYDAALYYASKAEQHSTILDKLGLEKNGYILSTVHRQENTDDRARLSSIMIGLATSSVPVVLPLHPRTKKCLENFDIRLADQVLTIDPVGYLDMVMLEKCARLIATDSGGVQKEAYFHRVPCITLREETEWVELVESGWNQLVGANSEAIMEALSGRAMSTSYQHFYGNANASTLVVNQLLGAYHL